MYCVKSPRIINSTCTEEHTKQIWQHY